MTSNDFEWSFENSSLPLEFDVKYVVSRPYTALDGLRINELNCEPQSSYKEPQVLTTPFTVNLNLLGLHDSACNCVRTVW